jgi:hypothetical protein
VHDARMDVNRCYPPCQEFYGRLGFFSRRVDAVGHNTLWSVCYGSFYFPRHLRVGSKVQVQ